MVWLRTILLLLGLAVLSSCGTTGQEEISHPLFGHGTTAREFSAGAWSVSLEVARVDLGPVYFCATEGASSELCPAAVAEFRSSAVINALDPMAQGLGRITGVSGTVRSATWDYGLTWFETQLAVTPTQTAPGGHSAHFEGRASSGVRSFRFVSDVDVEPMIQGSNAVQGARVNGVLTSQTSRLDVVFDPSVWWSSVDFDELAAVGTDPVVVPKTSRAHNAVVISMTTTGVPTFTWH